MSGGEPRRRKAERLGRRAEFQAALYLLLTGHRIVARRFRCPFGEVDLIARRGDLILLVEVKARNAPQAALDAVGYEAQRRIQAAGEAWIARRPDFEKLSWRCDVIAICPRRLPVHFRDVW